MKRLPVKNIIITIAALIVIQIGSAFLVSPALNDIMTRMVKERTHATVQLGSVRVWPVTLSFSAKNVGVFDQDDAQRRIASIGRVSVRLSPVGLLRGRIVVARASVRGAEVTKTCKNAQDLFLRGGKEGDGQPPSDAGAGAGRSTAGRFEIASLEARDVVVHLKADDGDTLEVASLRVSARHISFGSAHDITIGRILLDGRLVKEGKDAGRVRVGYARTFGRDTERLDVSLSADTVDLAATRFLYRDSLPVNIERGILDLKSKVSVRNGSLVSEHAIRLSDHVLSPKNALSGEDSLLVSIVCAALNERNPFSLEFPLDGTIDHPDFGPFLRAVLKQVKPSVASLRAAF